MKRYYVSVTETLNKVVSVDAESKEEAKRKVQDAYDGCDIILDSENFSCERIELGDDQEYWKEVEEGQEFYTNLEEHIGVIYQHIED